MNLGIVCSRLPALAAIVNDNQCLKVPGFWSQVARQSGGVVDGTSSESSRPSHVDRIWMQPSGAR
jgi:hypothetical protein